MPKMDNFCPFHAKNGNFCHFHAKYWQIVPFLCGTWENYAISVPCIDTFFHLYTEPQQIMHLNADHRQVQTQSMPRIDPFCYFYAIKKTIFDMLGFHGMWKMQFFVSENWYYFLFNDRFWCLKVFLCFGKFLLWRNIGVLRPCWHVTLLTGCWY